MASGFVLDPKFAESLAHTRGTLNPIGNKVRSTTDKIARKAHGIAIKERAEARSERDRFVGFGEKGKNMAAELRALAWAMRVYADSIHPTMLGADDGEDSTTGRVTAYYAGSTAIEFGGADPEVNLRDTDHPLVHHAHAILRRAVDGA